MYVFCHELITNQSINIARGHHADDVAIAAMDLQPLTRILAIRARRLLLLYIDIDDKTSMKSAGKEIAKFNGRTFMLRRFTLPLTLTRSRRPDSRFPLRRA